MFLSQGDSGGPAFYKARNKKYNLIGIVSHGLGPSCEQSINAFSKVHQRGKTGFE